MMFVSTRGKAPAVSASEAILQGLAPDGGLYVPSYFPHIPYQTLLGASSYAELAYEVLSPFFVGDELSPFLADICVEAFNFPIPLHYYDKHRAVLELYWGPTAAFKDFGARFLACAMEKLLASRNSALTILVATSGDTGGAVASAFHKRTSITVKVLYPLGRVSSRQEKQLTCWDGNIESYAVRGSFDDCQKMVKDAFMDQKLANEWNLSSANSINLGRLLPQMVYAYHASMEMLQLTGKMPSCIIPSGNVGNSCGAYWAQVMGAPIESIALAVNENRTICDYLATGHYEGRPSIQTLANAMDVGDPSNMERLIHLFGDFDTFSSHVSADSVSNQTISEIIRSVYVNDNYILCPHTATGEYVRRTRFAHTPSIVYATAHPAKFDTIVEPLIEKEIPIPPQLDQLLHTPSSYKEIAPDYQLMFS